MTNLELITQNAQTLEDFLEAVQDDTLEAEGCSYAVFTLMQETEKYMC